MNQTLQSLAATINIVARYPAGYHGTGIRPLGMALARSTVWGISHSIDPGIPLEFRLPRGNRG